MLTFQLFDSKTGEWVTQGHDESIRITTDEGQVFVITESNGSLAKGGIRVRTPNMSIGMAPVAANMVAMKEIR